MNRSPKTLTDELRKRIVRLYVEDELTQRQIAGRLAVSVNTVGDVLKAANVTPNRSKRIL